MNRVIIGEFAMCATFSQYQNKYSVWFPARFGKATDIHVSEYKYMYLSTV